MRYEDLEILISPAGAGKYTARASYKGSTESHDFTVPSHLKNGVASLIDRSRSRVRGEEPDRSLGGSPANDVTGEDLGVELYRLLFGDETERILSRAQGSVKELDDTGLCLRIKYNLDGKGMSEVAALPWELMPRPADDVPFSAHRKSALVRELDVQEASGFTGFEGELRIGLIVSNPPGTEPLQVEDEVDQIVASWKNMSVVHTRIEPPTLIELGKYVSNEDPHILHFIGHGTNSGELVLEKLQQNAEGETERVADNVTATQLKALLGGADRLQLVFLNACNTAKQEELEPWGSVAVSLFKASVPAVIAMRYPITDKAAIAFADALYGGIASGKLLSEAMSEGRNALLVSHGDEVANPVLYLGPDLTPLPPPPLTPWERLRATGRELRETASLAGRRHREGASAFVVVYALFALLLVGWPFDERLGWLLFSVVPGAIAWVGVRRLQGQGSGSGAPSGSKSHQRVVWSSLVAAAVVAVAWGAWQKHSFKADEATAVAAAGEEADRLAAIESAEKEIRESIALYIVLDPTQVSYIRSQERDYALVVKFDEDSIRLEYAYEGNDSVPGALLIGAGDLTAFNDRHQLRDVRADSIARRNSIWNEEVMPYLARGADRVWDPLRYRDFGPFDRVDIRAAPPISSDAQRVTLGIVGAPDRYTKTCSPSDSSRPRNADAPEASAGRVRDCLLWPDFPDPGQP